MSLTGNTQPSDVGVASPRAWIGPVIAIGAAMCALGTFLLVSKFGRTSPTDGRMIALFVINGALVTILLVMVLLVRLLARLPLSLKIRLYALFKSP